VTRESFVALVGNAALLLSLVYVYDLLNVFRRLSGTWIRQVFAGLAIGANGIFVILMPWTFQTGITFDTRSVLLAVSGLFFGAIPTAVAVLMTAVFRLIQGGNGAWTGVSVIFASGAIGVAWRHTHQRQRASLSFGSLYLLGLIVHVVMLGLMFTLPLQTAIQVLGSITLPVLVIFPITTAAYGMLMVQRLRRDQAAATVRERDSSFRVLFEQAAFGVAKADVKTGHLVLVNQHFADLLGYTRDELLALDVQAVTYPDDRAETQRNIQELASGRVSSYVLVKRYMRKDGGVIWVNITASRLWGEGDEPDFIMAAIEDITDRKRTQEALVTSELQFHELYENMTSGCAIYSVINDGATGADYIVSNFNRAALRMEGKTIDEVAGKSLRDLRPRIDDYGLIPVLREVWRTGQPAFFPGKVYEDERFDRWYENYVFRIPSGQVVTIYDDVTDRKRAEDALAISEERHRLLFESMPIGILYFAPDGTVISANAAAESILGLAQGEFVGEKSTDPRWRNIHEDGSEFIGESLPSVRAMHSGEAVRDVIVGIFNHREEAYRWVRVNAIPQFRADETSPYQVYVTMEDITERRAMEQELAHLASFPAQNPYPVIEVGTDGVVHFANAATMVTLARLGLDPDVRQFLPGDTEQLGRLRQLCEQHSQTQEFTLGQATFYRVIMAPPEPATLRVYAVDITETKAALSQQERYLSMLDRSLNEIYVFDEESLRFVYVNGAALRNLGYSLAELQQMTPLDIKPAFTKSAFEELLQPLRDGTREVLVLELVHRRKDGTTYPVEVHLQRFQGEGQSSFLAFVNDITDRKRADAERQQMQAQLLQSQKMEAVGELAGGVAHDFNNMLTGILGNVAIVKESMSLNDPLHENVDAIRTAAQQAANLTRGLLTFSRGAMVQPVALDTNVSVERTLVVLTQSLPDSVTIINKLQPGVWNVFMDQSQMTQILLNLGVNARDSMKGRGTLTVGTRNTVVDAAYVQAHPFARIGDFVVLSVADTGPGISPEILQHIFEPFFTTKPVGDGTGLGLSIVYGVVKQTGGWVTVQSDPGEGALFEVYLPRLVEQLPPAAVATRVVARPCVGTVLVVEDEPVVSAVILALLSRAGYDVLVAADGTSALRTLQDHGNDADLILLDMTMPGMTTEEILAEVRRLYPMLPVLLTSGYTSSDAVKHMLDEGIVQGFLAKPYETEVLFATVARLMHTTEGGPR
jgi:PAS domain S-box-containing protein